MQHSWSLRHRTLRKSPLSRTHTKNFMLYQLRQALTEFPSHSVGLSAPHILTVFRKDHISVIEELLTEAISQTNELSQLALNLSLVNLKRTAESHLQYMEEGADTLPTSYNPISRISHIFGHRLLLQRCLRCPPHCENRCGPTARAAAPGSRSSTIWATPSIDYLNKSLISKQKSRFYIQAK